MTPNEYQKLALKKEADQLGIVNRLRKMSVTDLTKTVRAENAFRGLSNEVGEIADLMKSWIEYGRGEPKKEDILEECGDMLWRTSQLLASFDLTMVQAMRANLKKLNVRYIAGMTEEEADHKNRDTDKEMEAVRESLRAEDDGPNYEKQPQTCAEAYEQRKEQLYDLIEKLLKTANEDYEPHNAVRLEAEDVISHLRSWFDDEDWNTLVEEMQRVI